MGARRRPAWVVALVVLVLGAAALPLHARAMLGAKDGERRSEAARAEAANQRDERHREVVQAWSDVGAARWAWAIAVSGATATERRTAAHLEHRQLVELALAAAADTTASTADSLEWTRFVLGLQDEAMAPLGRCLQGVRSANAAVAAGDRRAAAAALDAATGPCLQVRSAGTAPALPFDFPDPHVVRAHGRWWAYATNSNAGTVQLASSVDLRDWRVEGNALASLPAWAVPGATWAPAAVHHGGRWHLYYTVRERHSGLQCISVATAASAAGPFHDPSAGPMVCERDEGGSIDPEPVVDDHGQLHLLWKTELDTRGHPAELRGAPVDVDGATLAGPPVTLLRAAMPWEGRTIEGPSMVVADGYHLLYSGGSWNGAGYAVGSARCESVLGPCARQSEHPVLSSTGDVRGPGGLSAFPVVGGHGVAYHAWQEGAVGYPATRYLHIGRLHTAGGTVAVEP